MGKGAHRCRRGSRGLKVLAATVVGTGVNTITMSVSHEAEFDSGGVIHHVIATDRQRIHALQSAGLRLGRLRTHGLAGARVGCQATDGEGPASFRVDCGAS